MFARPALRELDMQPVGLISPLERFVTAEHVGGGESIGIALKRLNNDLAIRRPIHDNCIQSVIALGETNIGAGERCARLIRESAAGNEGRAFAEGSPTASSVNGSAIDIEPSPDGLEHFHFNLGNRPIRARSDVQEQTAVLAYDVDQVMHDRRG
jgi:hypothetical protein